MWGVFVAIQNREELCGLLSLNAHKIPISPTHKKTQNSHQHPMIDLSPSRKDQEPETMVWARGRSKQKPSEKYKH